MRLATARVGLRIIRLIDSSLSIYSSRGDGRLVLKSQRGIQYRSGERWGIAEDSRSRDASLSIVARHSSGEVCMLIRGQLVLVNLSESAGGDRGFNR